MRPFPPSFDKMQNHNAQESIHASFEWYKKEVTGLFLSATSVVQYLIFSVWSTDFLHSCFRSSYCISMQVYSGYFSKMKEIMNVNRRIIFSFEKKIMIKLTIMVNNYAPFHLITDPDLCERFYLHDFIYLTGF